MPPASSGGGRREWELGWKVRDWQPVFVSVESVPGELVLDMLCMEKEKGGAAHTTRRTAELLQDSWDARLCILRGEGWTENDLLPHSRTSAPSLSTDWDSVLWLLRSTPPPQGRKDRIHARPGPVCDDAAAGNNGPGQTSSAAGAKPPHHLRRLG